MQCEAEVLTDRFCGETGPKKSIRLRALIGSRCTNDATEERDNHQFCWVHSVMWDEGRISVHEEKV